MFRRKLQNIGPKAVRLMDLWHCHLRNLAFEAGLIDSKPIYTKFIILGKARTGSNYLRGLLNSQREIVAFGEMFRHRNSIGWDFAHLPQSRYMQSLFQNNPTKFLETRVFSNFPKHICAIGFKIFYYHAHSGATEPIWSYLKEHKEIRVIHIKRKNILRTLLSNKRATLTQAWVRQGAKAAGLGEPIFLGHEECLTEFIRTSDWERQYDTFFEHHEKMDVIYERLSLDYGSEMKRIQDFLGVTHKAVTPRTAKQSSSSLSDSIVNYFELKESFIGTPWEELFDA